MSSHDLAALCAMMAGRRASPFVTGSLRRGPEKLVKNESNGSWGQVHELASCTSKAKADPSLFHIMCELRMDFTCSKLPESSSTLFYWKNASN